MRRIRVLRITIIAVILLIIIIVFLFLQKYFSVDKTYEIKVYEEPEDVKDMFFYNRSDFNEFVNLLNKIQFFYHLKNLNESIWSGI